MHWVDGWQGYKGWHKFGDTLRVENPQWLLRYGISPEMIDPKSGRYLAGPPKIEQIKVQDAVNLAQIHSRDYQFNIEELYLAALNVTLRAFPVRRPLPRDRWRGTWGRPSCRTPVPDGSGGSHGRAAVSASVSSSPPGGSMPWSWPTTPSGSSRVETRPTRASVPRRIRSSSRS